MRSTLPSPSERAVRSLGDGSEAGTRRMLARYQRAAAWHATRLDCPNLTIDFDQILDDPLATTERIASFLGVRDAQCIGHAARAVGARRRLAWQTSLYRYLVRAPQKATFRLAGLPWPPVPRRLRSASPGAAPSHP